MTQRADMEPRQDKHFLERDSLGIPSFSVERDSEMAGTFSRGAQTMNSMFFRPVLQKAFHTKSSRDKVKLEGEGVKSKSHAWSSDGGCRVPHEWTGIYCHKGQEKVIADIPPSAVKDVGVNWISYNEVDPIWQQQCPHHALIAI